MNNNKLNIKLLLFLLMLSPVLWTLATSVLYFVKTLNIEYANMNVQVYSNYDCEYEKNLLMRKIANILQLYLSQLDSTCFISAYTGYHNISIGIKTYHFKFIQFEKNETLFQKILNNKNIAFTYTRDGNILKLMT